MLAREAIDNAIEASTGEAHGYWLRRARSLVWAAGIVVGQRGRV